jgi:hypothetical protein
MNDADVKNSIQNNNNNEHENKHELSPPQQTRTLQFRHYKPRLRALKYVMIPMHDPIEHMEWINTELMTIVEEGLTNENSHAIASIQQRKMNADIRRDLEPANLELKKRTRMAINKLIKENIARLQAEEEMETEEMG